MQPTRPPHPLTYPTHPKPPPPSPPHLRGYTDGHTDRHTDRHRDDPDYRHRDAGCCMRGLSHAPTPASTLHPPPGGYSPRRLTSHEPSRAEAGVEGGGGGGRGGGGEGGGGEGGAGGGQGRGGGNAAADSELEARRCHGEIGGARGAGTRGEGYSPLTTYYLLLAIGTHGQAGVGAGVTIYSAYSAYCTYYAYYYYTGAQSQGGVGARAA